MEERANVGARNTSNQLGENETARHGVVRGNTSGLVAQPELVDHLHDPVWVAQQLEVGEGSLSVGDDFSVVIEGRGATVRLERGVGRMLRRLSDRTAIFFPNETFLDLRTPARASLTIRAERMGAVDLGEDESYRLTITENQVELQAATDLGLGRETMHYLLKLRSGRQEGEEESSAEGRSPFEQPGDIEEGEEGSEEAETGRRQDRRDSSSAGGKGEESLRGPLLLLASSLAALVGSVWFFCSRASSLGGSCLQKFLGALF